MASARTGVWLVLIGAVLILVDGITVLATGHYYGWHYGGVSAVGWTEIVLSIIMFIITAYYKRSPSAVGWTNVVLAFITMPFDGGFWTIGAWLAVIGGAIIATSK